MSSQGNNNNIKPDKNLMIASKILDRNSSKHIREKNKELYIIENKNNNNEINNEDNNIQSHEKDHNNDHIFNPTSFITPYIPQLLLLELVFTNPELIQIFL